MSRKRGFEEPVTLLDLDDDCLSDILSRIPVKYVSSVARVCSRFHNLIFDPTAWKDRVQIEAPRAYALHNNGDRFNWFEFFKMLPQSVGVFAPSHLDGNGLFVSEDRTTIVNEIYGDVSVTTTRAMKHGRFKWMIRLISGVYGSWNIGVQSVCTPPVPQRCFVDADTGSLTVDGVKVDRFKRTLTNLDMLSFEFDAEQSKLTVALSDDYGGEVELKVMDCPRSEQGYTAWLGFTLPQQSVELTDTSTLQC